MAVFPRCKLYRTLCWAVIGTGILASGLMPAPAASAQSATRKGPPKGPRALGLLQLSANGKAHLIPITILFDGEFYDASAYKAAPVPMALQSGTVYEAIRTGVSQGLFTVSSALQGNNTWIGEGTWKTASELAASSAAAAKKKEARSKPAPEPVEGPPVLRRASAKTPESTPPAPPAPPAPPSPVPTTSAPAPSAAPTPTPPAPAPTPAAAPAPTVADEDPDRPVLKRGTPSPAELKKRNAPAAALGAVPAKPAGRAPATSAATALGPTQLIPAISDADGPDPRPYAYALKSDEEAKLRQKILALAADEVRARAAQLSSESAEAKPTGRTTTKSGAKAKLPQPAFEDVQLRVFDLSNSNEPVLVLTTKARMPERAGPGASALQYIVTVVARDDIYGELHKAFSSITDTQHLDVLPRMELIDVVDADGGGRGELLFREISDAGNAFVLYRVIGDRLWPLFQGTPGQ